VTNTSIHRLGAGFLSRVGGADVCCDYNGRRRHTNSGWSKKPDPSFNFATSSV